MLSIVIVFLAFSKLMLPSVQALGTVVRVRDAKAFADALLDPLNRVDVIEIEKDIDLEGIRERVASLQAPVLWRKDLNIRGARPEQPRFLPLLNFRFLENAVRCVFAPFLARSFTIPWSRGFRCAIMATPARRPVPSSGAHACSSLQAGTQRDPHLLQAHRQALPVCELSGCTWSWLHSINNI